MPRNRRSNTEPKESNSMSDTMFTVIEDENELAAILSGARGRGDYKTVLSAFIESGHRLVQIPLSAGLFEGKKPTTVKSGFENAKSGKEPPEGADKVKVVRREDNVYLVNQAVATA